MRQIILDTETTGIGPEAGHKIIEIGCVELVDRQFTGRHFHEYLNPQREVDPEAFKVHGISDEFLRDKALFSEIYEKFIQFIQGAELIIHNAPFDLGFLNWELKLCQHSKRINDYCAVIDTLVMARKKHPGQKNNLDALCKRYHIDNSNRELHGALLDAEILGWVYLAMTGGQASLFAQEEEAQERREDQLVSISTQTYQGKIILANPDELSRHQEMVSLLVKKSGKNYFGS